MPPASEQTAESTTPPVGPIMTAAQLKNRPEMALPSEDERFLERVLSCEELSIADYKSLEAEVQKVDKENQEHKKTIRGLQRQLKEKNRENGRLQAQLAGMTSSARTVSTSSSGNPLEIVSSMQSSDPEVDQPRRMDDPFKPFASSFYELGNDTSRNKSSFKAPAIVNDEDDEEDDDEDDELDVHDYNAAFGNVLATERADQKIESSKRHPTRRCLDRSKHATIPSTRSTFTTSERHTNDVSTYSGQRIDYSRGPRPSHPTNGYLASARELSSSLESDKENGLDKVMPHRHSQSSNTRRKASPYQLSIHGTQALTARGVRSSQPVAQAVGLGGLTQHVGASYAVRGATSTSAVHQMPSPSSSMHIDRIASPVGRPPRSTPNLLKAQILVLNAGNNEQQEAAPRFIVDAVLGLLQHHAAHHKVRYDTATTGIYKCVNMAANNQSTYWTIENSKARTCRACFNKRQVCFKFLGENKWLALPTPEETWDDMFDVTVVDFFVASVERSNRSYGPVWSSSASKLSG
ncbi:unnamed protein product [Zymoseptoria tritici ST99CH_1A5]|uniref:Uncharacterized protein n=1 Tax=Zymoseptoria tritici ST99CH_1A5 TaxID=1276529 RepID=A0A1Y6LKL5_ZYMTR|nr:unnamed protein product [Zymoseptoria tritici ST99CH_1A5]